MAALPAALLPLLDEIGGHRSSRAAAAAIAPRLSPGAEVVAIHSFPPRAISCSSSRAAT